MRWRIRPRPLLLHEEQLALRLMSLGFGIGSLLFAVGAVLSVFDAPWANPVFALGALFFTGAATVQWRAAVHHSIHSIRHRAEFDLRNPDWQAAVIQLLGTLYFNVMTIQALSVGLTSPAAYNESVWKPDALGSTMFLLSSIIAMHPVARRRRHAIISQRSNAISWCNLAGSVFFAVSAYGAKAIAPDALDSTFLNNVGTFLGAIGFLLAAMLLWPPRHASDRTTSAPHRSPHPSTQGDPA